MISLVARILEGKTVFKSSLDQVCGLSQLSLLLCFFWQSDKYLSEEILWILSEKSV